jgi:hypothetical protein
MSSDDLFRLSPAAEIRLTTAGSIPVILVDNVYERPDDIREMALALPFDPPGYPYPGKIAVPPPSASLSTVAQCVQSKGLKAVHLTGLTDPRGTEEYNMALGDRRAQSAKSYLKSLGVAAEVSASSMGEELASGADESCWSRDRRVDVREK